MKKVIVTISVFVIVFSFTLNFVSAQEPPMDVFVQVGQADVGIFAPDNVPVMIEERLIPNNCELLTQIEFTQANSLPNTLDKALMEGYYWLEEGMLDYTDATLIPEIVESDGESRAFLLCKLEFDKQNANWIVLVEGSYYLYVNGDREPLQVEAKEYPETCTLIDTDSFRVMWYLQSFDYEIPIGAYFVSEGTVDYTGDDTLESIITPEGGAYLICGFENEPDGIIQEEPQNEIQIDDSLVGTTGSWVNDDYDLIEYEIVGLTDDIDEVVCENGNLLFKTSAPDSNIPGSEKAWTMFYGQIEEMDEEGPSYVICITITYGSDRRNAEGWTMLPNSVLASAELPNSTDDAVSTYDEAARYCESKGAELITYDLFYDNQQWITEHIDFAPQSRIWILIDGVAYGTSQQIMMSGFGIQQLSGAYRVYNQDENPTLVDVYPICYHFG